MFTERDMDFNGMKILVIDDDKNALILLNHILKNRFIVDTLNDSRQYLEKMKFFRPDLILLDIMMPEVSGLDICRALKANPDFYGIPVILITAKVDETDVYEGLESGAVDYIKKPFSELELIARIHNALKVEVYIRKLKILNKLKDSFLSMVSHDVRTPLTAMMGFSELLLEEKISGPLTEKQKKIVNQILDSAHHQNRIIKDLLSLSILESGSLKINPESVPFSVIADAAVNEVVLSAGEKKITITTKIQSECDVYCDRERILQVLVNLLANAIKFTPEGGSIEIGAEDAVEYSEIYVKDSGIGIPRDHIDKIFDEYELFTTRGTKGEKGTGLGINICNRIVKDHGGTMFVQSEEGHGATFYFTLPHKENDRSL